MAPPTDLQRAKTSTTSDEHLSKLAFGLAFVQLVVALAVPSLGSVSAACALFAMYGSSAWKREALTVHMLGTPVSWLAFSVHFFLAHTTAESAWVGYYTVATVVQFVAVVLSVSFKRRLPVQESVLELADDAWL